MRGGHVFPVGIDWSVPLQWIGAGFALHLALDHRRAAVGRGHRHGRWLALLTGAAAIYLIVNPMVALGSATVSQAALPMRMAAASVIWIATPVIVGMLLDRPVSPWLMRILSALLLARVVTLAAGLYVDQYRDWLGPVYGPAFLIINAGLLLLLLTWIIGVLRAARTEGERRNILLATATTVALILAGVAMPELRELGLTLPGLPILWWASMAAQQLDDDIAAARARAEEEALRLAHDLATAQADLAIAESVGSRLVDATHHELRTPMTVILAGIEMLNSHIGAEDQRELVLGLVGRNARRMQELVEHLLSAQERSHPERQLRSAATRMINTVATALTLHPDRPYHLNIDPDLQAWVDPLDATSIVAALVSNAMRHGGPNIVIEAEQQGQVIVLDVADDGAGVQTDAEEAMFDAFQQGSSGLQRRTGGLGLGLWIARDRARANRGDLLYDRSDGWTHFRLTLPAPPVGAGRS